MSAPDPRETTHIQRERDVSEHSLAGGKSPEHTSPPLAVQKHAFVRRLLAWFKPGTSAADLADLVGGMSDILGSIPVVGTILGPLSKTVSLICKSVDEVKSNQGDINKLAKEAAQLFIQISHTTKNTANDTENAKYEEPLRDLKQVCDDIVAFVEQLKQLSCFWRFMNKVQHKKKIRELRSSLRSIPTRYIFVFQIQANISFDELRREVTDMRNTVQLVHQRQILSDTRASLEKLNPVSAEHTSDSVNTIIPYCMDDTRTKILDKIQKWARGGKASGSIYWLSGLAGTGKSTVARTVCRNLAKELDVVSFFISEQAADRCNPSRIPGTLAYQLAWHSDTLRPKVSAAVEKNPLVAGKSIQDQVLHLIKEPLNQAAPLQKQLVFVIDALDQCEIRDNREGGELLPSLVAAVSQPELKRSVKLLIVSDDRPSIRAMLPKVPPRQLHKISSTKADIKLYLETCLGKISANPPGISSSEPWPAKSDIDRLVKLSGQSFIFASTLIRFLDTTKESPSSRLEHLLKDSVDYTDKAFDSLYLLYRKICEDVVDSSRDPQSSLCSRFRKLVGTIIVLKNPQTSNVLAKLTAERSNDTEFMLQSLSPVLLISKHKPIEIFHPSFSYFLRKICKTGDCFRVEDPEMHQQLALQCLKTISDTQNTITSPPATAAEELQPGATKYALESWTYHVCSVSDDVRPELWDALCSRNTEPQSWIKAASIPPLPAMRDVTSWAKQRNAPEAVRKQLLAAVLECFLLAKDPGGSPISEVCAILTLLAKDYQGLTTEANDLVAKECFQNCGKRCEGITDWDKDHKLAVFCTLVVVFKMPQKSEADQRECLSAVNGALQESSTSDALDKLINTAKSVAKVKGLSPGIDLPEKKVYQAILNLFLPYAYTEVDWTKRYTPSWAGRK